MKGRKRERRPHDCEGRLRWHPTGEASAPPFLVDEDSSCTEKTGCECDLLRGSTSPSQETREVSMMVFRDGVMWQAIVVAPVNDEGSDEWFADVIAGFDTSVDMAVSDDQ